jgi:hypothetical protein
VAEKIGAVYHNAKITIENDGDQEKSLALLDAAIPHVPLMDSPHCTSVKDCYDYLKVCLLNI